MAKLTKFDIFTDNYRIITDDIFRMAKLEKEIAWSSSRKLTRLLYDRKIPLALTANVYETIIIPALKYGCGCLAIKVNNKRKIATTETRMLHVIIGVSRRDHMQNEEIRRITVIAACTDR